MSLVRDIATPLDSDLLWMVVCLNLAWDHPRRLNYRVCGLSLEADPALRVYGPPRPPFTDRRMFEDWCGLGYTLPPGRYQVRLANDVRTCSIEAIGLILELAAEARPASPPRKAPSQSRLRAHLDGRPPYLTLDDKPAGPMDEVAVRYLARLIEADGEPVAFTRFIEENPAFRGSVVTRVMGNVSKEISRYIERPGRGWPMRLRVEDLQ
jgi:hypothetical protein